MLKNCPFCNHEAVISKPKTIEKIVYPGTICCTNLVDCFSPHILWSYSGARSLEQAIVLWNKRHEDKEVEKLE